jgi:integrase
MNKVMTAEEIAAAIQASGMSMKAILAAVATVTRTVTPGIKAGLKPKAKPISNQAQTDKAGPGTYRAKGAVGLYLNKGEKGLGSWFFRFRFGSKRREMGLGSLADVSLVEAQDKAVEAKRMVRSGVDPITAKRTAKVETLDNARAAAAKADRWSFARATEEYLKAHAPSWKHPRARQVWHSPIVKYAYPVIGQTVLDDIEVAHVKAVMDAAEAGGAPQVAPRIRLRIEQILNAATVLGKRGAERQNPASIRLIKAVRPMKEEDNRENFRRIGLDEAPAAFQKILTLAKASTPVSALAFMILTAARPSEALTAQWSEIDMAKKLWSVPKEKMKGSKPHVVPLSDAAMAVLERQMTIKTGEAVFPRKGGGPVSYGVFSAVVRGLGFDVGTPHSWRSIFRDAAEDRCGYLPHTAEAALAHSLGKVEAAYRRETGVEKRRGLMDAYAAWLNGQAPGVVPFRERA